MAKLEDTDISRAIIGEYSKKLLDNIESDVLIAGAGPAGMTAGWHLAEQGFKVVAVEKRLSPGGGIWGGALGMNEVVIQQEAEEILQAAGVRMRKIQQGLLVADAMELASALCLKFLQQGGTLLNLFLAEDVCLQNGRVTGLVVNRTTIAQQLPVDPMAMKARAVVDATGHEAAVVQALRRRGLLGEEAGGKAFGEFPMDANEGEKFVVEKAAEIFPGLWVAGMSVCTVFRGPRMGPIFGGMLMSGKRVADLIAQKLA